MQRNLFFIENFKKATVAVDWVKSWVEEIGQQLIKSQYLIVNTKNVRELSNIVVNTLIVMVNLLIIFTATHVTDSWN